jgi:hypothetical protein
MWRRMAPQRSTYSDDSREMVFVSAFPNAAT